VAFRLEMKWEHWFVSLGQSTRGIVAVKSQNVFGLVTRANRPKVA
jgi:hypothetical protein